MTNQIRGVVTREIGGEMIELRLSANEWCGLEDEFGKQTSELMAEFIAELQAGKLNMKVIRAYFRAALSSAMPGITHSQAGDVMAKMDLVSAAALLGEVISASVPQADEHGEPGKPKAPTRKVRG